MNKTVKVILWVVAIGIVLYFAYKAYKRSHPTVTVVGTVNAPAMPAQTTGTPAY